MNRQAVGERIARLRPLAAEFGRYLIVGGTAFLVDCGVLYGAKTFLMDGWGRAGVYAAAALGFAAGLVYNYLLSLAFVFRSAKERNRGRTPGAFALFAVIGAVGLGLTEGGMFLLYGLLGVHYLIAKLFVAGFVLVWNYAARKWLIFR